MRKGLGLEMTLTGVVECIPDYQCPQIIRNVFESVHCHSVQESPSQLPRMENVCTQTYVVAHWISCKLMTLLLVFCGFVSWNPHKKFFLNIKEKRGHLWMSGRLFSLPSCPAPPNLSHGCPWWIPLGLGLWWCSPFRGTDIRGCSVLAYFCLVLLSPLQYRHLP